MIVCLKKPEKQRPVGPLKRNEYLMDFVENKKRKREQREEVEKAEENKKRERTQREEGEKAETENEQNELNVIMFSVMFNTCNCLYIDNMSSTSRLGLKPSKPIISL